MSDFEDYFSDEVSDDYYGGDDVSESELFAPPTEDISDEDSSINEGADLDESEKDEGAEEVLEDYEDYEEESAAQFNDLKKASSYNKVIVVVKPENRRTSNVMSKFEMTECVSIRATQIAQYNNCMVDTTGLDDPILQSKRELMQRMCPLTLRRYVGEKKNEKSGEIEAFYEYFSPNEMTFSTVYSDIL